MNNADSQIENLVDVLSELCQGIDSNTLKVIYTFDLGRNDERRVTVSCDGMSHRYFAYGIQANGVTVGTASLELINKSLKLIEEVTESLKREKIEREEQVKFMVSLNERCKKVLEES